MKLDEILKSSHARYIASDFCANFLNINKRIPLIIDCINCSCFADIKKSLLQIYGDIEVLTENEEIEKAVLISNLEMPIECILVEGRKLTENKKFDLSDLEEIMNTLRSENGCEWDKAQSHNSIRINLIEEAYELVEAIDLNDKDMMLEEAGDVLLQAIFHTQIAKEEGDFDYSDMITALCRKLIDRHTHIFGENHAQSAEEALVFWQEAKKKEKKYKSSADAMNRVPRCLPALLYAEKIQKIAKKSGFDWDDVQGPIDKIDEELKEFLEAESKEHKFEEAGDLLFAVVNVLRFLKIDPEMALHQANQKFYNRFKGVEKKFANKGIDMKSCSLEQLDKVWDEVKVEEKAKILTSKM